MKEIKFTVFGNPIGKARPKVTRFGTYTPKKTRDYEQLIRECWAVQSGEKFGKVPLGIKIRAIFSIPASYSKKKKAQLPGTPHIFKPDIDNVIKSVTDALNGYAYPDDSQICKVIASKEYGNTPGLKVTITDIINMGRGNETFVG